MLCRMFHTDMASLLNELERDALMRRFLGTFVDILDKEMSLLACICVHIDCLSLKMLCRMYHTDRVSLLSGLERDASAWTFL